MEPLTGGLRCRGICKHGDQGRPLISIVMAVLNRANCIGRAIESVISQSYGNIELIIIDGGSSDGTLDILKQYDSAIDYWSSEPDSGIYDAINKGIAHAGGDWINIQGSDDYLFDSIAGVASHLVSDRTVYYGDLYYHYQRKVKFGKITTLNLVSYRFGHHRFFFPRSFFSSYRYDVTYPICADYEMFVRAYSEKRYNFEYLPIVIASFNELDGAGSRVTDQEFLRHRYAFLRSHFPICYVWLGYLNIFLAGVRNSLRKRAWPGDASMWAC